jgi:hypothetical protein
LYPNIEEFRNRDRLAGDSIRQRLSFEQFHGDKRTLRPNALRDAAKTQPKIASDCNPLPSSVNFSSRDT